MNLYPHRFQNHYPAQHLRSILLATQEFEIQQRFLMINNKLVLEQALVIADRPSRVCGLDQQIEKRNQEI